MRTIKPVFLNSCLTVLGLTTSAVKVRVMKTNNASITDHKPGDIVSPVWGQDTVALWGVIKRDRQKELEPETDLFSKLSAEGLVMEAGWIAQVVTVHLSSQEDAQLHHLLQHSGRGRLHGNVIVQLCHKKETQLYSSQVCTLVRYLKSQLVNNLCGHLLDSPPPLG